MSDVGGVFNLEELETQSDDFRARLGELIPVGPYDAAYQALVDELRAFLDVCAAHGRYIPISTLERRGLRNMVDYWRSRLERDGYAVDDIPALAAYDPNAGVPLEADCPYPGLEPYDDDRKTDFFGREKLARDYADKLEAQGVFLVIGGSGSGKSSVALAGVRPICQARHSEWCFPAPIKPGSDPLGALAASIAAEAKCDAEELARQLKASPADAASLLGDKLGHAPTLLIIDQFEEGLTLCRNADAQKAFADALLALAPLELAADARRFYLLFTLRTDYFGRLEVNPGLKRLCERLIKPDCHAYLPAMEQDEILQAILKPAQRVRLRFVPAELAVKLAGQTASLTNGLPLLQFALQRLWEGRAREPVGEGPDGMARALDFIHERQLEDVNNPLPNVASALGTHAERVYQALESQQKKDICERLILELVFLDESFTEAVRRRRPVAELCEVIGCALGAHRDEVLAVIEVFVKERLLRRFKEKGEDQLEVAHEALLRHWSTINTLVYGDEAKARLFRIREVQKEASDWINKERNPDWLKRRGEPLITVEKDVAEFFLFDEDSKAYVAACRADEERIKAGEKERLAAEKRAHDALLAQKEAERERAEAELTRALAAQEIAEQKVRLSDAGAEQAKIAKQVAEQQSRLLEVEQEKRAALDAKMRAEDAKREAERQEQERARRRKRFVVGVGILGVVILLAGASYVKQRNDSNLSAVASLSDRLPPWEGLDLTRRLAESNEIFSGALGLALERMDDARIVGARGSVLTLVGDGDALLNLPTGREKDNKLCLYGLEKPGAGKDDGGVVLSSQRGVCVDPSGQFERGALGAELTTDGPLKGKRLFVAIFRAQAGTLDVKAWLVDLRGGTAGAQAVQVSGLNGAWFGASQVVMRPDGREASFAVVEGKGKGKDVQGRLITLALKEGQEQMALSPDESRGESGPKRSGPKINALGYVSASSGGPLLVRASQDGLSCGSRMSNAQEAKSAGAAALAIATAASSDVFAVWRGDGQIGLFRCAEGGVTAIKHDALKGDFSSVSLQLIEHGRLLLSVQLAGSGRQCYDYDLLKKPLVASPRSCNPNHPVYAAAHLSNTTQVAIELSTEAPVIRRYPAEFDLEAFRLVRAAWQGNTVLCPDGSFKGAGASGTSGGSCAAGGGEKNVLAVLSPSGSFMGQMVRSAEGRAELVVRRTKASAPDERKWSSSNVVGDGLAVDDQGWMAYFEGSNGQQPQLMIVESSTRKQVQTGVKVIGEPACLNFSPSGKHVVLGTTAGGTFRYGRESGKLEPPASTGAPPGGKDASKADPDALRAAVTACAIADDGAAVFGFRDGQVRYFDGDLKTKVLTEQVVYRLPAEVKAVSIGAKSGAGRRITALGAWQPNNCLYPALPGQSLRVWELGDEKMEKIPVSNVCFPNQPILAIGGWTQKPSTGNAPPPTVREAGMAGTGAITSGAGIQLLLPQGVRWHACPGCRLENESDAERKARLVGMARDKGSIPLQPDVLNTRYGLKLGW